MPDRYSDFASLSRVLAEGVDYAIRAQPRSAAVAVVAPHGGGIEPGTSELAEAIAGGRHSFYAFEGVRRECNRELHITSTRFDEPQLMQMVKRATSVIALHGESSEPHAIFIGGLDDALGLSLETALREAGFHAGPHDDPGLQGREAANLCNRGASGAGVQLEISAGLRRTLFASLTRTGRGQRTARFAALVAAISAALR